MTQPITKVRRARERRGRSAEYIAAAALTARGYVILARRVKTPLGEIDLIARRGGHIAFVEVKQRGSFADCEAAITSSLQKRVRDAADMWLAKRPRYQSYAMSFDVVFVVPWRWPRHIRGGL